MDRKKDAGENFSILFYLVRHGRALAGESPEHAQVVGNV